VIFGAHRQHPSQGRPPSPAAPRLRPSWPRE
jgi:hypothetical protein